MVIQIITCITKTREGIYHFLSPLVFFEALPPKLLPASFLLSSSSSPEISILSLAPEVFFFSAAIFLFYLALALVSFEMLLN